MTEAIIVALISLVGTALGAWAGIQRANQLTVYRIEQLEHKMDKHNSVIERMTVAEKDICDLKEDVKKIEEARP